MESKIFGIVILSITGLIVLCFVFGLGVSVGTRRADFSYKWAEQYHNNFAGPVQGFFESILDPQTEFIDSSGVIGQVIKIDGATLTIKGSDNVEKIIIAGKETLIMCQRQKLKLSELKSGDSVVIVGEPNNNGQVEADLIRIMPIPARGCLKK